MTGPSDQNGLRIGLDLGGSKIEGILMGPGATELARYRVATPRNDYAATIAAIVDLTARLNRGITAGAKIGVGVPGSISPLTGLMQNANSTWLNGRSFDRDLAVALATPVRLANDANCFALSEAIDGAAENARIVFGGYSGNRMRRWPRRQWEAARRTTRHWRVGATTRFLGPRPTNTPDPTAGADAKGAWKHGSRAPAWLPIMPG